MPYPYSTTPSPNVGTNVGINVGINERQARIVQLVAQWQGAKLKDLQTVFDVVERTLERDMQLLRKKDLVTLQGSKKTGKYQLTERGKQLLSYI